MEHVVYELDQDNNILRIINQDGDEYDESIN
jgi:hypothetical protein